MVLVGSAVWLCFLIVLIDPGLVKTAENIDTKSNATKTGNKANVTLNSRFFGFINPIAQLLGGDVFGQGGFHSGTDRFAFPQQVAQPSTAEQPNQWNTMIRYPDNGPLPIQQQYPTQNKYPSQVQYPNEMQYPRQNQPIYPDQGTIQGSNPIRSEHPNPINYPNEGQSSNQQVQYPVQGQYPNQSRRPAQYPNTEIPQGQYPNIVQGPVQTEQYPTPGSYPAQYLNQGNVPVQGAYPNQDQNIGQYPRSGRIPEQNIQYPIHSQTTLQGALPNNEKFFEPNQYPNSVGTPGHVNRYPNEAHSPGDLVKGLYPIQGNIQSPAQQFPNQSPDTENTQSGIIPNQKFPSNVRLQRPTTLSRHPSQQYPQRNPSSSSNFGRRFENQETLSDELNQNPIEGLYWGSPNEPVKDQEYKDKVSILGKPVIGTPTSPGGQIRFDDKDDEDDAGKIQCAQDCPSSSEYAPICGSNNVTYFNHGRFICARDCGIQVHILQKGRCY